MSKAKRGKRNGKRPVFPRYLDAEQIKVARYGVAQNHLLTQALGKRQFTAPDKALGQQQVRKLLDVPTEGASLEYGVVPKTLYPMSRDKTAVVFGSDFEIPRMKILLRLWRNKVGGGQGVEQFNSIRVSPKERTKRTLDLYFGGPIWFFVYEDFNVGVGKVSVEYPSRAMAMLDYSYEKISWIESYSLPDSS